MRSVYQTCVAVRPPVSKEPCDPLITVCVINIGLLRWRFTGTIVMCRVILNIFTLSFRVRTSVGRRCAGVSTGDDAGFANNWLQVSRSREPETNHTLAEERAAFHRSTGWSTYHLVSTLLYVHVYTSLNDVLFYVAAKATYIRLLHGKIGLGGGGSSSVKRGRTHIVLGWM